MHETIFGYSMNIIFIMIHQSQKILKNWPCAAVILLRVGYYKIQIQHNLNWVGGNIRTPWFIGYPLYFHKKIQEILPEETWMRNDRNKRQKSSNCLISPSIAPTTLLVSLDSWGDETKISKHAIDYKYTIYLDKVTEGYNNKADILNVQLFYLHLEEWTLAQWFVSCKTAFSQTEHFTPYFYMFSSFKKRQNQVLRCFTSLGWGMFDSL